MTSKKENGLVVTNRNLTKTEEEDILNRGLVDLSDFMDNFQYLCFVLDGSGSTHSRLDDNSQDSIVDLEKKVILNYVNKKIGEKAATMKIGIVEFDHKTKIHLHGSSDLNEIKAAVSFIGSMGGGTTISKGIRGGLTLLKKNKDFTPRIVLTSDGEFGDSYDAVEACEQAKAAGIIIDTIYVGRGTAADHTYSDNLKKLSAITGGVHEEITSSADFEAKFLKVADRPLLGTSM